MAILYLTEQQAWVGREGDCLVVHAPQQQEGSKNKGKRERKMTIPLFKVEEVLVLGDITLSTPALTSLLDAKVQVTYLSQHGRYLGTLCPLLTKNSVLRLAQHQAYANMSQRHAIAQRFVIGKLRNMKTLLVRSGRAHPDSKMSTQIESIKRCISAAKQTQPEKATTGSAVTELDSELEQEEEEPGRMHGLGPLLGYEGAGSAAYFSVFGDLIKCGWSHGFYKRVRRPPGDPVNALLSYGYVILTAQVASALASVGFDPYVGYLHASRYGKPALALDLMEEFRPIIVDSVVLSLFNNRQLEQKDFCFELNACRMTEGTKRLFLHRFEERMQETIRHPVFEYRVSYRRCLELQARLLGKYLTGEIPRYLPFTVR